MTTTGVRPRPPFDHRIRTTLRFRLAPYQAQGYFLLDLRRVTADDLPAHNLLREVAALEQSRAH